uniref:ULP_PROTEASE domain-containing protein n=1 Tax=Macrostomum lignano TaxID=282301 RepID=A0A1I8F267_9PLAT
LNSPVIRTSKPSGVGVCGRLNTTCSPPSKRLKETISFDSILPDRSNSNSIDNLSIPLSHTMIGKSKFRALTRIGLLRLSLDCVEFPFNNSSDGHNGSSDSVHREASLAYIRIPHKIVTVTYFATKPLAFIGYRPTDKVECARICQQAGLPEDYLCCATTGARRWVIGLVAEDKSDADPLVSNIQQLIHWYERAGSQLCVRIMKLNDVSGRLHPPSLQQQQQQQQQARRIVFIRTQASPSLSQPTQPAQAQLSLSSSSVQTVRIIISPSAAATSKAITLPTLVPQPPPPPPPPLIEKFTYRPGGSNGITITDTDLACLRSGNYLNDVIIDFYLKYILHELLTPEQRARTHLFNSFFYKRLAHCAGIEAAEAAAAAVAVDASVAAERRHASVAKWTRKVDLFSKDFIIIPINENYHWFLVVICFPMLAGCVDYNDMLNAERAAQTEATAGPNGTTAESTAPSNSSQDQAPQPLPAGAVRSDDGTLQLPCVLVFDSLSGTAHRGPNVKIIREYLQVEWDIKKRAGLGPKRFDKGTMRGFSPHVPQQPNFVDCGPYVLHYAEMFYKRPIPEFTKAYFQEHMRNWFNTAEIQNKRAEMQQLIVQLYRKLGPDKPHCGGDDDPIEESEVTAACQTESCRS